MKPVGIVSLVMVLLSLTAMACPNRPRASQYQASAKQEPPHANGAAPVIDTAKWKIYRNEKYGFEVKYPETWNAHSGSGTGVDLISLDGPFRGSQRPSLTLAIQRNQNPGKRSIEEWFADQLHALGATPQSTGHMTIGGRPAVFMENTNSFGKRHDTFILLHETNVLSLSYSSQAEYDPIYTSIVITFRAAK